MKLRREEESDKLMRVGGAGEGGSGNLSPGWSPVPLPGGCIPVALHSILSKVSFSSHTNQKILFSSRWCEFSFGPISCNKRKFYLLSQIPQASVRVSGHSLHTAFWGRSGLSPVIQEIFAWSVKRQN